MKHGQRFAYSVDGKLYMLQPDFQVSAVKIYLVGAQLYTPQDEYIGYWDRHQMPLTVINSLMKFIKVYYYAEVENRRKALARETAKRKTRA